MVNGQIIFVGSKVDKTSVGAYKFKTKLIIFLDLKHIPIHMTMSSISYFYPLPDKLQTRLRGEGGIKALLGMVKCGHPDVLAQVARGIANFAKCESRAATQGNGTDQSNVHMFSLMSLSLIVLWYEWVTHSTFQRCHARDIFCFSDCNGT